MIEFYELDDLKFRFAKNKIMKKPYEGLKNYGPVDLDKRNFNKMVIYFTYLNEPPKNLNEFKQKIIDNMDKIFRLKAEIIDVKGNSSDIILKELKDLDNKENNKKNIVLQFNKKFEEKPGSDYYKMKRQLIQQNVATQGLYNNVYNQNVKNNAYINNICAGLYAKCGGRAWDIDGTISNILKEKTIYIGLDISIQQYGKLSHASPGCIVVYDGNGQYIYHFAHTPIASGDSIPKDQAVSLLGDICSRYFQKKAEYPKNIVFMRDGDIKEEELEGYKDKIKEFKDQHNHEINFLLLEVRKAGEIPILNVSDKANIELASSGTVCKINSHLRDRPYDLFIQTMGEDFKTPTMPKAIKITPRYFNNEIMNDHKDIAHQCLALAHLNWSSMIGRAKLPIPVHFSHKASKFIEKTINPQNIEDLALWML